MYITQLLYSFYNNKKYKASERILHIDRNFLNCKRANLVSCDDKIRCNRQSISIECDSNYIFITHKPTGLKFITNYEPELFMLISSKRISWSLQNDSGRKGGKNYNRLRGEIFYNSKRSKISPTSLSELVFGYYNYNVRANNLVMSIRKMKKELRSKKYVVEHLIADELNNTKANLSLVQEATNSKKKVIDGKIQPPHYLIMAHKDNLYRAVYCFGGSGALFVYPTITSNSLDELINKLREVLSTKTFEYKSALEWHGESGLKKYNVADNYKIQSVLYDNFDSPLSDIKVGQMILSLTT